MLIRLLRFNTYLLLTTMLALATGCQSDGKKKSSKKDESSLRIYIQTNPDGSDRNAPVLIGRERPFQLNVEKKAFLTEFDIEQAAVLDVLGGFSISVQFNKQGTWLLEQYTTANKGKQMAIAAEFGELRWLAAPAITKRLGDGLLVFTPDATREEAERIVRGLNRVAEQVKKGKK